MRKYHIHVTWAQGETQILYASFEEVSKRNYDKQFDRVITHKNIQNCYNENYMSNITTNWNLLFALKIWNCFNFVQKTRLIFFP